jgi:hypothetical protein
MDPHELIDRLRETTRYVRETEPDADASKPLSVVIEHRDGTRYPVTALYWDPAEKVLVASDVD